MVRFIYENCAALHAVHCSEQKTASEAVQRQGLLTSRGPAPHSSMADSHARAAQQLQPRAISLVDWPHCPPGCCGVATQASRRHKDQLSRQPSTQPLRRGRSSQSQLWLRRTLQPRATPALVAARPRRHALQRGRRASGCAACCPVHMPAIILAVPDFWPPLQASGCTGIGLHITLA